MSRDKRTYVAVLMGGVSSEREVSLHSGPAVARALEAAGFEVYDAVVDDRSLTSINGLDLDAAFVALHGEFGEDGGIQALLEAAGIPYVGTGPEASRACMDKVATKRAFAEAGIPTPEWRVFEALPDAEAVEEVFRELGPKVVVKPAAQGSSIGVTITGRDGFDAALEKALSYDGAAVVERFVKGRELTVGIIGDRALPIIELRPHREFFDYTAKYQAGETDYVFDHGLPPELAEAISKAAIDAFACMGCRDLARVDVMLGENGEIGVLEVNTIPGFTATSLVPKAAAWAGTAFPDLCRQLVEMALERCGAARPA